jgi:Tfp pilus assembly protein PilF
MRVAEQWSGPPAAHPLDGPRGKIVRAIQQALVLNHQCDAYSASRPVRLVARFDAGSGAHLVYVEGRPPPLYLGLILGETIHDLRSGLDQLAWQLALQQTNPSVLARRSVTNAIQFPISRSEESFRNHPAIQYIDAEAVRLLEICQPYHNIGTPLVNPLALVQELSNTDKHQLLRPSLGQIRTDDLVLRSSVPVNVSEVEPLLPHSGVFVGDTVPILRVPAPEDANIAFDPPPVRVHFIQEATDRPGVFRPDQVHKLCLQIGEVVNSFEGLFPTIDWADRVTSWVTPGMEGTDYSHLTHYPHLGTSESGQDIFARPQDRASGPPPGPERNAFEAPKGPALDQGQPWQRVLLRASRAKGDSEALERIYRKGLGESPDSPEILASYAEFLAKETKNLDQAEEYFRRALDAAPHSAAVLGNYALFLKNDRKEFDRAAEYFRRAIKDDPHHAKNLGNYANLLADERKDLDAERYFRRALEEDPQNPINLVNYACFLTYDLKDVDGGEVYFRRALETDPKNATVLGNYAVFLTSARRDVDGAEEYYRRAVEADPQNATNLGGFAMFLEEVRGDPDGAEECYRRAVEADPQNGKNLAHYAGFLAEARGDVNQAEEYFQRALEAAPQDARVLGAYALFLTKQGKDLDLAEEYFQRAFAADPRDAALLGAYALFFLADQRKDLDRAEEYFRLALEADPNHSSNLHNYALFLKDERKDVDRAEEYFQRARETPISLG